MPKKQFKFYPQSFGDLTVKVKHMDLYFQVFEDHTIVTSTLHFHTLEEIKKLDLNAKNLEIVEVSEKYKYHKKDSILEIKFGKKLPANQDYKIITKTICRPTSNILEGLYYDETPTNCPKQQITQCQQWGFQRIVPCIDDMTAKCTYKTIIEADERYTNYLTNGDIVSDVQNIGDGRIRIKYENCVTPMATYLFFLGVGTYATFKREFIYPEGTKFDLELLVPPNSDKKAAEKSLDILYDAILYIHLFTGPDKYENWNSALEIRELIYKRNKGQKVQDKIDQLYKDRRWGYKYTGTVYREIGMQNSDFGGMENVGNTTITTNRIMPFKAMTDVSFEYMIAVKVHEFYHNLNGSEVTGRSPFEIWLNEAVTVFIEQEYGDFLFGKDYQRIDSALRFMAPGGGTFAMDENAASMPIEPDGFNDPNELITGVTYVKAPEFVRMIETLMGKETFVKGLDLYHTRYKHSNASRAQWVEAMEEASGQNFTRMAETWLKQASYPKVDVKYKYQGGNLKINLTQHGFKEGLHWEFPFTYALCREDGSIIHEDTVRVANVEEEIIVFDCEKPAFVSLNRNFSFFGKVFDHTSKKEQLVMQVRNDKDVCARFLAFNKLAEDEKMAVLKGKELNKEFIDLYFEIFSNEKLIEDVSPAILTIFAQVEDEKFAHDYEALYQTVKKIKTAIAKKYHKELVKIYEKRTKKQFRNMAYVEQKAAKIKNRQIKNTALALLAKLDTKEVQAMIKQQYQNADCATDEIVALGLYLSSSAKDKDEIMAAHRDKAAKDLVAWESFLATVARGSSDDTVEIVKKLEKDPAFRIDQANDQRALYCAFAGNRRLSLMREDGLNFLKETILKLAEVNEYSCGYILKVFGNWKKMAKPHRQNLKATLEEVLKKLDQAKTPSVYNTIARILAA
jgi:aminopeptidase N